MHVLCIFVFVEFIVQVRLKKVYKRSKKKLSLKNPKSKYISFKQIFYFKQTLDFVI